MGCSISEEAPRHGWLGLLKDSSDVRRVVGACACKCMTLMTLHVIFPNGLGIPCMPLLCERRISGEGVDVGR